MQARSSNRKSGGLQIRRLGVQIPPGLPLIVTIRCETNMKILKWVQRVGKSLKTLLRDTRAELRKVVWPSWGQVRIFTVITLAMIAFTGIVLWGTDGLMTLLVGLVLNR